MKKLFLLPLFLLISGFLALAQGGSTLSGVIKDSAGEPVIGAAVMIEGTTTGVITDLDGHFTFNLPSNVKADAKLIITSLGYSDVVVPIGNRKNFDIVMAEETSALEESVVIGYSTVKKKDLTGALSTVEGTTITARQTQGVTEALQGAMPGVTVTRTSSMPGDEPNITIRGITSMTEGATKPYVLIDGVPGNLSDINPGDIESMTVLKDAASASIYGSQAAAGVILVTTKRAKEGGKASVSYDFTLGIDSPTAMPTYMNAVEYMEAVNELKYNDLPSSGWYQAYDKNTVENYWSLNKLDPDHYPNVDWLDMILKDNAIRQSHLVKFSASKDKVRSSLSFGYDKNDGLYKANQDWERFTLRLNNDIQIFKWLKLSADLSFKYTNETAPHASPALKMRYIPSIYQAVWSTGKYAPGRDSDNIYAGLMSAGEKKSKDFRTQGKFQIDITPVKGLTITGLYAPKFVFYRQSDFQRQTAYYKDPNQETSTDYIAQALTTTLDETRDWYYEGTFQAYANYQETFGKKHNFGAMAGYENYYMQQDRLLAGNSSFPNSLIQDLSAGSPDAATNGTSRVYELARNSIFGRLMYNYDSRYYAQFNVRADASSRFAPENRWGVFLSGSAGWQFSNEEFFKPIKNWWSLGKLRVSYGELGNERINSYYPYQSMLSVSHPVGYIDGAQSSITGYAQSSAVVPEITWEKTATIDAGIDLAFFKNRLSATFDWYYKKTTGMLIEVPVAPVIGLSNPYNNLGDMHTKGWEFTIGWNDTVGDFTYKVNFNLSDDVSIMGNIQGKEVISNGRIIKEGVEYNSWYGYKTNGLIQTAEQLASTATLGTQEVGDVCYVNIYDPAGSSAIITAEHDRTVLGSSLPHFNFGGSINLYWKGIDFGLILQGVGKRNGYLNDYMVQALRGQVYNFPSYIGNGNSWSYKNTIEQNQNALYPRYSWKSGGSTSTMGNYAYSDYWIIDGSYLRIKNISLGYTFPSKWMDKVKVQNLRLGVSLSDFFTFSHYPEGWDPEVGATGYPITKSVLFSLSVNF